jgi:DegV family protein with EDD domain
MRIRLVADSACDVPDSLAARYNIRILPAYINFGLESFKDDGVSITKEDFYQRLRTTTVTPTTSAFPPGEAKIVYEELLQEADHVISFHLSSNFSGIFSSALVAAKAVAPEKITVVDTDVVSMAAGWIVIMAAEMVEQGADLETILEEVKAAKKRATLWAAPETLDFLRRSGRINWLVAGMGALLQIKPLVIVKDGTISQDGRVRTFKNAIKELIMKAHHEAPLERLAILHLDNLKLAQQMEHELKAIAPPHTITLWASSAIAIHFGPGGLGVATLRKKS